MSLLDTFRTLVERNSRPRGDIDRGGHQRVRLDPAPEVIYAIGDVHGCYGLLAALQSRIDADARQFGSAATIVLGDVIDRGPATAGVIDLLLSSRPAQHPRHVLLGNHEALFEQFLARPSARSDWLGFGGAETLASYGIPITGLERLSAAHLRQLVESHIPVEHRQFIAGLPLTIETSSHFFAHAGIRPGVDLGRQAARDLLWFRDLVDEPFDSAEKTVVHGHTTVEMPVILENRIAIDTGAYLTGRLTAVRIVPGRAPVIITQSEGEPSAR